MDPGASMCGAAKPAKRRSPETASSLSATTRWSMKSTPLLSRQSNALCGLSESERPPTADPPVAKAFQWGQLGRTLGPHARAQQADGQAERQGSGGIGKGGLKAI